MITKKFSKRKYSLSDIILIALLIVFNFSILGFLLVANSKLFTERNTIKGQNVNFQRQIKELEQKNDQLRELFASAEDSAQVEKLLREKALYKKEGEKVVAITREEAPEIERPKPIPKEASVLEQLTEFLRSLFLRD